MNSVEKSTKSKVIIHMCYIDTDPPEIKRKLYVVFNTSVHFRLSMLYSVVRIIYTVFTHDAFKEESASTSKYWFHDRNRESVYVIHCMDIMNCILGTTLRL